MSGTFCHIPANVANPSLYRRHPVAFLVFLAGAALARVVHPTLGAALIVR
jgi:hypothetical protein